jgi:hypothetical protein
MYGLVEGDLLWAYDMQAMGQELQPHLWGRLVRPVAGGRLPPADGRGER